MIAVGLGEEVAWHSLCGADFDFAIERKMMVEITVTAAIPFPNQVTGRFFNQQSVFKVEYEPLSSLSSLPLV